MMMGPIDWRAKALFVLIAPFVAVYALLISVWKLYWMRRADRYYEQLDKDIRR